MAPTSALCTLSLQQRTTIILQNLCLFKHQTKTFFVFYIRAWWIFFCLHQCTCQKWLQLLHCVHCHAAAQRPGELHPSRWWSDGRMTQWGAHSTLKWNTTPVSDLHDSILTQAFLLLSRSNCHFNEKLLQEKPLSSLRLKPVVRLLPSDASDRGPNVEISLTASF